MAKKTFYTSPVGVALYPWINKPDTKYNPEGLFKVKLAVGGDEANTLKAQIDGFVDEAYEEYAKGDEKRPAWTPKDRKAWGKQYPYEEETDEEGAPTGRILFTFKQNATIHLKDGTTKDVTIGIRDSEDKALDVAIFGGSKLRVMFSPRQSVLQTSKKVGVRLDFALVQVIELAKGSGSSLGFGAYEGGYVGGEHDGPNYGDTGEGSPAPASGDDADY